jgi:hypothetical protein
LQGEVWVIKRLAGDCGRSDMWQKGGVQYGIGRKEMGHEGGRFERKEVWQERCLVEGMCGGRKGRRFH